MSRIRLALIVVGALAGIFIGLLIGGYLLLQNARDPYIGLYEEKCSVCHGDQLQGGAQGVPLVGVDLKHGDSVEEIAGSIARGSPELGMPAWSETLNPAQIKSLAILIAELRVGRHFVEFNVDAPVVIPAAVQTSEEHAFRVERVTDALDPLPFSIAPLPDGSILVSEKMRGLRIVSPDGALSDYVAGTPDTWDYALDVRDLRLGVGWLLDVDLHPDYERNGWVYLHHTHILEEEAGGGGLVPRTMNRLVRGRIRDGRWVDEEVIWHVPSEFYSRTPDIAAGGRIAFDRAGHVFVSVGMKGMTNYDGIQDLASPYGKIHRVHDDGRIPSDNPFLGEEGAFPSIWTYGHRSPQGLEFDPRTGLLWSSEMGPRGGDEVNLLRPGRNYGWPLYSKGLDYDGTPVEYGEQLGIELDLDAIEQPVSDFTPSPAICSFSIYDGALFPRWRGNLIIGSLKGRELHRVVLDGEREAHRELLLSGLARIRDVETGPDGALYLLLEHGSGGQIVRLVPEMP